MAVPEEIQEKVLAEATSATPNYSIDYNSEPFQKVNQDYKNDVAELEQTYNGMIDKVDGYYKDLSDNAMQWADKQAQIQQENTDFAIEKIEQQKEQAQKDYIKEQSGAYVDWRKQSNQYGAEAEKMASAGLDNTGYSESSQVSMYNTYQNRVATAREVAAQAKLNYDNGIKEAMLQNNAALAQIYADAYEKQLTLALEGFQYKNQLVLDLTDRKQQLKEFSWTKWQDTLQQINTENALKENIRQYNETQKWNTEQKELDRAHASAENELNRKFEAAQAELDRAHAEKLEGIKHNYEIKLLNAKTEKEKELLKIQHQNDIAKLNQQLANEKALLNQQLANEKAMLDYEQYKKNQSTVSKTRTSNSSSSSGSSSKKTSSSQIAKGTYTPSNNVKKKIQSLNLMRGQTGSKNAIANSIVVYCAQGDITTADAEYMLKYFGYNPDNYLD